MYAQPLSLAKSDIPFALLATLLIGVVLLCIALRGRTDPAAAGDDMTLLASELRREVTRGALNPAEARHIVAQASHAR